MSSVDSSINVAPMHPVAPIHESMHELLDMLKVGPFCPVAPINSSVDDPYVYPTIPLKSLGVLLEEGLYVVKYFEYSEYVLLYLLNVALNDASKSLKVIVLVVGTVVLDTVVIDIYIYINDNKKVFIF
jgi:hypothetical protein